MQFDEALCASHESFPPPEVRELSATAIAVYAVIEHEGPRTYDELAAALGASDRAVWSAVKDLRANDVVLSVPDLDEPNRLVHGLVGPD